MTIDQLIELLQRIQKEHPERRPMSVQAVDVYGEGEFPIKGVIWNSDMVTLTGEETD